MEIKMNRPTLVKIIREMMKENDVTTKTITKTYKDENIIFKFFVSKRIDEDFLVIVKLYNTKRDTSDDFEIAKWYCTDSKEGTAGIAKEVKKYINILKRRFENE